MLSTQRRLPGNTEETTRQEVEPLHSSPKAAATGHNTLMSYTKQPLAARDSACKTLDRHHLLQAK